jgi:hypothetical protein
MGLRSNTKADSIEATVTETSVGKQRGLKRTDAAESNKITHPGTTADAKVKHVSPLADTILIVKEQERQHLLMAGMVRVATGLAPERMRKPNHLFACS